jgi:hypothetical protein
MFQTQRLVPGRPPVWQNKNPSRRFASRVEASGDVWVVWQCDGRDDISRVKDLSFGGVFIETPKSLPQTKVAKLNFLVGEGQIRADAMVRHVDPAKGIGLKFTAITGDDRPNLAALLTRLRSSARGRG